MTENDILKSIAENLSERKSTAALNNYEVLGNNIKYVNDSFEWGINSLQIIQQQIETALKNNELVTTDFKEESNPLFYFRNIIPRIIQNDISIIDKFISLTKPDDRRGITIETVGKLKKSFTDFNNLVTSARQFIDSLVADSYQLIQLNPKETNFHVLTSLNSFGKYATKSIKQGLFNAEIQKSLTEFENLSYNEKVKGNESSITKCSQKSFGNKVNFLFRNLNLTAETDFQNEIKNLFSFSSEFTHIGYVSTFFTSSNAKEVIFTDNISPYLSSTENFSELKYEILETATKFYVTVYLPSLISFIKKAFKKSTFELLEVSVNQIISKLNTDLKTRNNQYYFFIKQGLIGSNTVIDLPCICGTTNNWNPPHDLTNIYCKNCGSKFNLLEIEGDSGYIITSNGPVKVIGSTVPDFDELPPEKQFELLKKCEEVIKKNTASG
ncbi:hypothetical protein [Tenacibaculum finnmarkense]|uniref:hypothetical protein n=1 Tax=Tenacibaculum finnmarkense TaxID=2781243 RepID=UPI00187B523E|nr:hypothetical protein [Tenacibaculum finnmarkense]MBE7692832.1 hypothetical protein [Tenacibaculum finnmarkense genomovar finnmarkense]WCC46203.1 hypothetical protein PJH08_07275 [Tenacibaculum finnmarkense]